MVDYAGDTAAMGSFDVANYTAGAVLATRTAVKRAQFAAGTTPPTKAQGRGAFRYRDIDLDFIANTQSAHYYEFRFWWQSNLYTGVNIDRVRVSEPRDMWGFKMAPITYLGNDPNFGHETGEEITDGWQARANEPLHDRPATIVLGPWTYAVLPGHRQVVFRLSAGSISGLNLQIVANVDVNDYTQAEVCQQTDVVPAGCVVPAQRALRALRAIDFPYDQSQKDFVLEFDAIGNHGHEFRVGWYGLTDIRVHSITVR